MSGFGINGSSNQFFRTSMSPDRDVIVLLLCRPAK
jgi:hypothetical protein